MSAVSARADAWREKASRLTIAPCSKRVYRISELPLWLATKENRVVVMPRARNGAKKTKYSQPQLLFTALELLAGPYRECRLGRLPFEAFTEQLREAGMRFTGSVAPSIAGEHGDAYFVNWNGQRRFLDFQILRGTGRDARFSFRIYFFWDDISQRVIVGSMPDHLPNSLS